MLKKAFFLPSCALLLSFVIASCTGDLIGLNPQIKAVVQNRASISGEFCTEDPGEMVAPVRIAFIVDCSGSMWLSDSEVLRGAAVQRVIDRFIGHRSYSFAIVKFGGEPEDITGGFTRDPVVIQSAIDSLSDTNGGTDSAGAVQITTGIISSDLSRRFMDGERFLGTYINIMLSDGVPNVGSNPEQETLDAVDGLMALESNELVGEIVLHSTYLDENPYDEAINFMKEVALHGTGEFYLYENASEINFDNFDYSGVKISFEVLNIIVTNTNALVERGYAGEVLPVADSDSDGLSDQREIEIGTSIFNGDTDGDGCSDFVEVYRTLNPLLKEDCSCEDPDLDSDGDGLKDCDEMIAFTDPLYFDTDNDGFSDYIETLYGTDPLFNDKYDDSDGDGKSNGEELRKHTNPELDETDSYEWLSYKYDIEFTKKTAEGKYCYSINIENITLVKTAQCGKEGKCSNLIKVYIVQKPQDMTEDYNLLTVGTYEISIYNDKNFDSAGSVGKTSIDIGEMNFETLK